MTPTGNDDELDDAYREASAGDAARPSAATRSAILAEARAAALRRTPAANDSRMWWRAAAGVSVLGVALLVWRQVDRPLAPLDQAPVVAQAPVAEAPPSAVAPASELSRDANELARPPEPFPATAQQALPTPTPALAERGAAIAEQVAADAAQYAKQSAPAAAAAAPPPPVSEAESRLAARSELSRSFATPERAEAVDAPSLFARQFPTQYASTTPPRALWVLEDAAGNVLGSGVAADADWQVVRAELQKQFADRSIGPWNITSVRNAHAIEVRIGVARLE